MKRFLALIAAIGMVAAAIAIRAAIDDDGADEDGGDERDTFVVACIPELRVACEALRSDDVEIRPDAPLVTADLLAGSDSDIDAWVTFDPWPSIADERAGRAVSGTTTVVASSPLRLVMWNDRAAALEQHCGGTVTLRCLGDVAGSDWAGAGGVVEWGAVRVGFPQDGSALGLLALGWAASSYFTTTDFGSNDFDADFRLWADRLANQSDPDPVRQFLQQGPGAYSAVATTLGRYSRDIEPSRVGTQVRAIDAEPAVHARVVVAARGNRGADLAGDREFREALAQLGWDTDGVARATGLPDAGVLLALATR